MHGPQKYSVFHLTLIAEFTVVFFFFQRQVTIHYNLPFIWDSLGSKTNRREDNHNTKDLLHGG